MEWIQRPEAMKLWDLQFGEGVKITRDFHGREIHKIAYGEKDSPYSWEIDHLRPVSLEGSDNKRNLLVVHKDTNKEKGNDFPIFVLSNPSKGYEIRANGRFNEIFKTGRSNPVASTKDHY